jgi:hypothetical protein
MNHGANRVMLNVADVSKRVLKRGGVYHITQYEGFSGYQASLGLMSDGCCWSGAAVCAGCT